MKINFGTNVENKPIQSEPKPKSHTGAMVTGAVVLGVAGGAVAIAVASKKPTVKTSADFDSLKPFPSDLLYIKSIAQDMTRVLGKNIAAEQLKSVMGKNELLSILPKMKNENYSPHGNLENGVFKIDLHSHSVYSDGAGRVSQLLEQAADYGDKLNAKTGEKFIFALSDHDEVEGTRTALKLIAQNPEKYKNLRFVPAVELSFAHGVDKTKSPNQCECSELLVHCINPFSEKTTAMIKKMHQKRESMIANCLAELNSKIPETHFSPEGMRGAFLKTPHENFAHNLHWRVFNYAQVKHRTAQIAKLWQEQPESYYTKLMLGFNVNKNDKSPQNFDKFLAKINRTSNTPVEDARVTEICQKYFPSIKDGKVSAVGENSFDDIVEAFSGDKNVSLGFAHPYFFAQFFEDPATALKSHVERANGLIKTTESYHQAYPAFVDKDAINKLNQVAESLNLIPMGGQDNHRPKLV